MYCSYCGRVNPRCRCHLTESAAAAFFARGGRTLEILTWTEPYKPGAPPQVKRRERATLRANRPRWRDELIARYGERCANCGADEDLALDHIIPIAKGGRSRLDNLQLLCAECNRLKGKLVIDCRAFKRRG